MVRRTYAYSNWTPIGNPIPEIQSIQFFNPLELPLIWDPLLEPSAISKTNSDRGFKFGTQLLPSCKAFWGIVQKFGRLVHAAGFAQPDFLSLGMGEDRHFIFSQ